MMAAEDDVEVRKAVDPRQWVDRYGDVLFRFARSRGCDLQIAEDIVQETFLAAWQARDNFAGRSSEQTWLIGILRRKIADHFRQSIRRKLTEIADTPETETTAVFDRNGHWIIGPSRWHLEPSALIERAEFWEVFDQCVAKLPPALADVYCLREKSEMTSEEICQILGISATNLWTRLYRARMVLRSCIERNWFESNDETGVL